MLADGGTAGADSAGSVASGTDSGVLMLGCCDPDLSSGWRNQIKATVTTRTATTATTAVITPSQDPYSLFFMAVPMYIFYEMSIIIGRVLKR